MKQFIFNIKIMVAAFFMASISAQAQNLVNNPSFESVNSGALQCSWYTTQAQFNSAINNWTCPTGGSSDIFVNSLATSCFCSPNSTNGSAVGPQAPRTGSVMVGGSLWGNGGCSPYREYFQGSLTTPLVAGTNYKIEFYVSLADNSKSGCNNIGLKFSTTPVNVSSMCVYAVTPDVNYTGAPISDKINWTKLEFCYTPTTTGLQYFMIGNFFSNVATTTVTLPGTNSGNAYYYLDDVSIVPSPSTAITPSVTVASNCSSTTTTLTALPASVNYTWTAPAGASITSGVNAQNALVQGSGVFTVSVQNPTACVNSVSSTTVLVSPSTGGTALTPTITGAGTLTCTNPGLTLSCNPTTGVTYTWTGSGITSGTHASSVAVNASGNYSVSITNAAGCIGTGTVSVQQNTVLPVINLTPVNTTITCATPTVQLSSSITPAASTYTWSSPAGGSLSNTAISNPVASGNGVFTLTATNPANGCVNTATASLIAGASSLTLSVNSASICSGGSTILTVNGNASSYSWSPAATLSASTGTMVTANPGATTTYSVVGSNGACTATTVVTVTVVPPPTPVISPASQSLCQGQSAALSVSGGATYTWSPAATLNASTGTSVTANPTVTTIYSVISAAGTCTASAQATVNVVTNPSIVITGNSTICYGANTSLTAQGLNTYTWTPALNLSTTSGSVVVASPPSNTTYTVNGSIGTCTAVAYVTVTVTPSPTLTVSPLQTICAGSTVSLTAAGAASYSWNPATYLSGTSGASVTSTPTTSITYTVSGLNGVCTSTATTSVNVNAIPALVVSPSSPSICIGAAANLSVSGASSYTWSPATNLTGSGTNVTVSPTVSTTYTVQGSIASCLSQTVVAVTVMPNPTLTISPNATICSGSTANLTVSGGYAGYSWTPMNGLTTVNNGINVAASPSSTSSYTVTGATSSGCTGSITVMVTVIPTPTLNVSANPLNICEGASSILNVSGATAYAWTPAAGLSNPSGSTTNATPQLTTVYSVTGTNGTLPNQCSAVQTITITVTPTVNLVIPIVNPICAGDNATLIASGASSYTWIPSAGVSSPNQSTTVIKPTSTTVYTLIANNGGLCSAQGTVEVVVNPLPRVYAGADTTVNIDESVTLHGTGNVPVEFLPNGSAPLNCNFCNSIVVNPQEKTCYTLRGTSAAGCLAYDEVCVNVTKEWNVYIPNAFTPNDDDENDIFIPVGYGITQIKLLVFDRWGTQIFSGSDTNPGWDGKLKGKLCEQGVYVYQVEIKTMAGNTIKKVGHVTLLSK